LLGNPTDANEGDFATISAQACELDQRIVELARARGVGLVEQQTLWYGWDPIHIRRRFWASAWRQMLAPWTVCESVAEPARASFVDELYLRLLAPQSGVGWHRQRRRQPCGFRATAR
jgi:hypothetical protein